MEGNAGFHEAENSTVHGHVIVLLDGEYTDLTLDQFEEYPDYIPAEPAEPAESGGQLGKLLRNIMKHKDPVQTRQVNLDGAEDLYAWLRDTADEVLAADPEWQAMEREAAALIASAKAIFSSDSATQPWREPDVE